MHDLDVRPRTFRGEADNHRFYPRRREDLPFKHDEALEGAIPQELLTKGSAAFDPEPGIGHDVAEPAAGGEQLVAARQERQIFVDLAAAKRGIAAFEQIVFERRELLPAFQPIRRVAKDAIEAVLCGSLGKCAAPL